MARYGTWRPLADNWASQPVMARPDLVLLHTMVGSLAGTDTYFRTDGFGGVESHFGVGADGQCWQWQDTSRRAEANLAANSHAISIETEDRDGDRRFPRWSGDDVPAWTAEQLDRLADLVAWCCRTHDIPCAAVPDSRPGRRGIGYHRLGIDPWRPADGEKWSTARGKVCPGDRRVAQVPEVIERAQRILAGAPAPTPALPTLRQGDKGPAVEALQRFLNRYDWRPPLPVLAPDGDYGPKTVAVVRAAQEQCGVTGPDAVGTPVGPRTNRAFAARGYRG